MTIDNSRFHDGLILFQFDTIAPNLVPSVSNYLIQPSMCEQMKKVPNSEIDLFDMIRYFDLSETQETNGLIAFPRMQN